MKNQFYLRLTTGGIVNNFFLLLFSLFVPGISAFAQCTVSSLNISTGVDDITPLAYITPAPTTGIPDRFWEVSAKASIYGTNTPGTKATVVTKYSAWAASPTARWISDRQLHANPGIVVGSADSIKFKRPFRICGDDTITFNLLISVDNYVAAIYLDGVLIPAMAQTPFGPYSASVTSRTFKRFLTAGSHSLEIRVNQDSWTGNNPIGILVTASITAPSSIIVNNYDCADACEPHSDCEETCFWKVKGNQILNGNNIFGTLSNDNIRILTNSTARGTITKAGLFGWNNMTPTAYLDVNCNGNNSGGSGLSDIRFRDLESTSNTEFTSLVIDPATGYVYNSNVAPGGSTTGWALLGNNISSANWMGTINNEDIRFKTFGLQRMVIKGSPNSNPEDMEAGYVGINTTAPTARFHVDCSNGNGPSLSDIRFENLETGSGTLLAIDAQGYVYNTGQVFSTPVFTGWDVNGNPTPSNNIFGITSPTGQDINIFTNGMQRGVLTAGIMANDDGRLGWRTPAPTAALHVNCIGANPDDGSMGSDVRFEQLETGLGDILVIDDQGYVYNSHVTLEGIAGEAMMKTNNEVEGLKKQVEELKTELAELRKQTGSVTDRSNAANRNELYQNNPNPFGKETTIGYNIINMQRGAYVAVYDMNGKELKRFYVSEKGKGSVTVKGDTLSPGLYLYSLVVDGAEVDTKRMVMSE